VDLAGGGNVNADVVLVQRESKYVSYVFMYVCMLS
jgi:hypothetical protein